MTSTAASRLRSLLRGAASNRKLLLHRFASSSSRMPEKAAESPRKRTANVFENQSGGDGCAAYNHAVRYSHPSTIKLHQQRAHLQNSVSLIGTVERTPTSYNMPSDWEGEVGAYAILSVKSSPHSNSPVRVLVEMWGEIAEVALEHVKLGDYIYVSGSLGTYKRRGFSGNDRSEYKVRVKELNFVKQNDEKRKSDEVGVQPSESEGEASRKKREEERLHLWQVFFSNPTEWYDNRQNKSNARSPDFKNKSTGEALWMNSDDPPWIKNQLQRYDTMLASGCFNNSTSSRHSNLSSYMSGDEVALKSQIRRTHLSGLDVAAR